MGNVNKSYNNIDHGKLYTERFNPTQNKLLCQEWVKTFVEVDANSTTRAVKSVVAEKDVVLDIDAIVEDVTV